MGFMDKAKKMAEQAQAKLDEVQGQINSKQGQQHDGPVTPFRADGGVNDEAAVALGRYLLQHGSDGLVVADTTGEGATLSDEELTELVRLIAGELGSEGSV